MRCLCALGSLCSFWEILQTPRLHAIIHLNSYRFSFPIKSLCIISYECNHRAPPSPLPSRRLGTVCVYASMCAHHFYPEWETELCRGLNTSSFSCCSSKWRIKTFPPRHPSIHLSTYNLSSLSIYPSIQQKNKYCTSCIKNCCLLFYN